MPTGAAVGRNAELAAVDAFLTVASRASTAVVIEAEPGIDKTTRWPVAP